MDVNHTDLTNKLLFSLILVPKWAPKKDGGGNDGENAQRPR